MYFPNHPLSGEDFSQDDDLLNPQRILDMARAEADRCVRGRLGKGKAKRGAAKAKRKANKKNRK